jgi:hypothetical protein
MLLALGGCSSSVSPDDAFTGRAWVGTATVDGVCMNGDEISTTTEAVGLTFTGDASGIAYTDDGCTAEFVVTGDTAALSNGPLTCTQTIDGSVVEITLTTFTLTSNGSLLTANSGGTEMSGGNMCNVGVVITASR